MNRRIAAVVPVVLLMATACGTRQASNPSGKLMARVMDSRFPQAHNTFNGISAASDGKIYYVLSSNKHDVAAQMYSYDPASGAIKHVGDLSQACGEKGAVAQGKSHVSFVEWQGKLYFSTHMGYYDIVEGEEKVGTAPKGFQPYQGGHFVSYDLASGKFEDLGIAPGHEGIITFTMDPQRGRLYGMTWPVGHFLRLDLAKRELKDLGPTSEQGEAGKDATYRTLCRSMTVDPGDGSVYYTTPDGLIHRYRYDKDAIETVEGDNLKKDYFGTYDPYKPGNMGYNWRQSVWYAPERAIYAVHGNSGYLFRFKPETEKVELVERITSAPSKAAGTYDRFRYGYLGFTLGPDGNTIYYLTGGPSGVKGDKGENLHLVTYSIPARAYADHGPIFFENGGRPTVVNSIAVGRDGSVYCLAQVAEQPGSKTDLVRIPRVD